MNEPKVGQDVRAAAQLDNQSRGPFGVLLG